MIVWSFKWAFLLFIPFVLVLVYKIWKGSQSQPYVQFSGVEVFKKIPRSLRSRLAGLPTGLKWLALLLVVVALARPQRADVKVKRNVEGIDIVIALDVSDSMLIEDMTPKNRLEASKKTISEFVQKRISDRIGLVVFSGESYTRVPLTLDYPLLLKSLSEVQTTRNIKMGTAIGVALANAVSRLKDSTAKSRVVVFLTDGENNSGTIDPQTAIEIAKGYGVKIYSIGMGQDGQAQLPVIVNGPGGRKLKRYRPIHSKINEELLNQMARETGGKSFRASTSQALDGVFKEINQLEKTKIEVNQYTKYAELFPSFVQWALVSYLLSLLLGQTVLRRRP